MAPLTWALTLFSVLGSCETFDYVIVGGGTAGLVLANRLSEDPSSTVVVIEAGTDVRDYPNVTRIDNPGLDYINGSIDYQYSSVPQDGLGNRSLLYHAGKGLGGTSNINGMDYIRGDKAQFDAWETLGNEGWNWDNLFPYFIRSENFTVPTAAQVASGASYEPEFHGEQGFLTTGFSPGLSNSSFYDDYLQSGIELGIPRNPDVGSGLTEGLSVFPQTLDPVTGTREPSARAYYQPVEDRPNLKVIQGTVNRITWGETYGKDILATGIEYTNTLGELSQVGVAKEVIVSAGTFRSPLILEASGIGNPAILSSHNIETRVKLPGVGEGMQDQQLVSLVYLSSKDITGTTPYATFANAEDIFGNDASSIAETTEAELATWAQTVSTSLNGAISAEALETRFQVQHDLIFKDNATFVEIIPIASSGVIGTAFWTLLPFSWGSVHLNTSSAADYPVISPNFITLDFDKDVLTAAGRRLRQLWNTAPLSGWVADQAGLGIPPLNATDDTWLQYIISGVSTNYHSIGTCAMLPRDLEGVVDSGLKVYGTRNVRVVDASVVPIQMSGHPTATLYGLAERAADLIKAGSSA
ncbi:hypothetical protein TruAng_001653 [Truncatella angustata]|nr:hypothetical protein TruAng_001653 [Truncatella angustata]